MTRLPVLVYGTLRPEDGSNYFSFIAEFKHTITRANLHGYAMYAHGGGHGFPYILPGNPDDVVVCDLVEFDTDDYKAAMRGMDGLEGTYGPVGDPRNHYDRRIVVVHTEGGRLRMAYVYVASDRSAEQIIRTMNKVEHGDWIKLASENPYVPVDVLPYVITADDEHGAYVSAFGPVEQ